MMFIILVIGVYCFLVWMFVRIGMLIVVFIVFSILRFLLMFSLCLLEMDVWFVLL